MTAHIARRRMYATSYAATRIVTEMSNRGISQRQLAKMLDVTEGMVSQWLSDHANLTVATIARIADALDCVVQIDFKQDGGR